MSCILKSAEAEVFTPKTLVSVLNMGTLKGFYWRNTALGLTQHVLLPTVTRDFLFYLLYFPALCFKRDCLVQ